MGDPAVFEELRQRVSERGNHSKQLKSPACSVRTMQDETADECSSDAHRSSNDQQHLTSPPSSPAEDRRQNPRSGDSPTGAVAVASERGALRGLTDSVAADTLSYFTLAENENGSSFYFLGTSEAEEEIATSPSAFLWNPSEARVYEVDAGMGTCRRVYRLPAEVPFAVGVGGCCCVSAASTCCQQRQSRHRQRMKTRRKRDETLKQEGSKEILARVSPSTMLSEDDSNRKGGKAPPSLPAEERPSRLLIILAEKGRLRQFSSTAPSLAGESENQNEAEEGDEKGGCGSMEETLHERNSLALGGVIYAVYALPSSSTRGTPRKLSPPHCLVVHAPHLSREEQQQQKEQKQHKKEQQRDLVAQGEKKQGQAHAAASCGQQRQQRNELHFTVVCCTSLKALATCVLPFPGPLSSATSEATRCRTTGVVPKKERCPQTQASKAAATDGRALEKVYLTGSVVHNEQQQRQRVINVQVVMHVAMRSDTGEALLNSSNGEKAPGELQGDSWCMQIDRMQVDVCLQASLEITMEEPEHLENTRMRCATVSRVAGASSGVSTAEDAGNRVTIICRSSFSRLGDEDTFRGCSTDRQAVANSSGDNKRRRISSNNSECGISNSSGSSSNNSTGCENAGSLRRTTGNGSSRTPRSMFISCFPDWSPLTNAPSAAVDGIPLSPLVMLSQQHNKEFQLFSMETSTARLLLSKRYRSLLFPERQCHVRGATLLSGRCFVEWVRGDETETGCLLLLRELMWGAPCSPVYRLDCSRYFEEPPVLLGSASYRRAAAATAVDLLWRGNGAVFSVPLLRPGLSHRRIVGACAGFPLLAVGTVGRENGAAAAVIRRKLKEDHALLLRAAGVGSEGRAADMAAVLLSSTSPRRQQLQQWELPFEEAWTGSEEERRKTEKAICSVLKEGMVPIPSALVTYIIEHAMERAAVQCCKSPLIQEASVVRFLLWRPLYFLPLVLGGQLSFSKSLLLQSLQQALAPGEGEDTAAAAAAVLEMLQLLSAWLKHYCSLEEAQCQVEQQREEREGAASTAAAMSKSEIYGATASASTGREPEQRQEDIPPLQLILDFIAILVGARLPEVITGFSFLKNEGSSGETQEKKLFLKVLKRVQQLLEAADGRALRRVEGRIFAALSAQVYSAKNGSSNRELVESFQVAL